MSGWTIGGKQAMRRPHCCLRPAHDSGAIQTPIQTGSRPLLDFHFDCLGPGFLAFLDDDPQYSLIELRCKGLQFKRRRQSESPGELSVAALHSVIVLFLDILLELALTADCEDVALDQDMDVFFVHFGQFQLDDHLGRGFKHVAGWYPSTHQQSFLDRESKWSKRLSKYFV